VEAPEGINDDPHEKGWMIEIELSSPNEASELLYGEAVRGAGRQRA